MIVSSYKIKQYEYFSLDFVGGNLSPNLFDIDKIMGISGK